MKKILFVAVLTVIVLSACRTVTAPMSIPTNTPVPSPTETLIPSTAPLEPSPTSTPFPTPTASIVSANATPYPYEGSYPDLGQQMLQEWEAWRKTVSGPMVENIPDGTVMRTESPTYSERLLLEAINRDMAPDLSGMDRGIALVNFNATPGSLTITPKVMAELEKQNVVLIFGFGITKGHTEGIYQTMNQMVANTDQPKVIVNAVLVGGSKRDLLKLFQVPGAQVRGFHDTAKPQSITMDMANKNVIYIVPLNKESLKQFAQRNGIRTGGEWDVLTTSFDQYVIMRSDESIVEFLGIPH